MKSNLPHATETSFNLPFFLSEERLRGVMKIVNAIALITAALAFTFGPILYAENGQLMILIPALTEGALFLLVPVLSWFKKWKAAIMVMFITQLLATTYFGSLIGPVAQVQTMGIFLAGIALLVFQNIPVRTSALFSVFAMVIFLELNYHYKFIPAIKIEPSFQEFLRQAVLGTVIFLNSLMLYFYVSELQRSKVKIDDYTKQLEKAKHAMSLYVRETSHEIRSPLNVIYGIVQTYHSDLAEVPRPGDTITMEGDHVQALNSACHNVLEVINNVLEWSKIEAGIASAIQYESVNLIPWLDNLTSIYLQLSRVKSVQLLSIYEGNLPDTIKTDRSKLNTILGNLLSNAIKFTNNNTTITFRVSIEGNMLRFEVTDQGKGLSKTKQESIFEPFVSEKNDLIQGTGLGLPLVKQMAVQLGGNIKFSSKEKVGSTFIVSIPFEVTSIPSEEISTPSSFTDLEGLTILVVDDNQMNRMIAAMHLHRLGIRVTQADSALNALRIARADQPDLILLDLHMPDVNGKEMIHRLQKDPLLKHIPILVISGDVFKEVQDEVMQAGAKGFISKPIIFEKLYAALQVLVKAE